MIDVRKESLALEGRELLYKKFMFTKDSKMSSYLKRSLLSGVGLLLLGFVVIFLPTISSDASAFLTWYARLCVGLLVVSLGAYVLLWRSRELFLYKAFLYVKKIEQE